MDAQTLLARWENDPALFAEEVLGVRAWSRQRDLFNAVANHRRVAVRSGHKVGKSNTIACLALWWVCTRPRGKVVLSSTVGDQLRNILWPELKRLYDNALCPIGGRFSEDYHGGVRFPDDRAIIALKSEDSKPEAFAGISSPNVLYCIDEASGFPNSLLEAAWGNTASNGTIAAFSNATRTAGWFFDAFHDKRGIWHTIHIDSRESPNITGECDIPGLARREWVAETAKAFGEDSPTFAVRVRGDFPREGDCVVVGLGLLEAALKRDPDKLVSGPLRLGLDVGRTGDDPSVLAPVRGQRGLPLRQTQGREGDAVAGWVLDAVRELRRDEREVPEVRIDVIGVGSSVYDHLKHSPEVRAIAVNVSSRPSKPEKYLRLRDEVWFAGADWLKAGGRPPDDAELHGELTAARYEFDGKGRYDVESKDEMQKRLKRSPNKADALNLAVCSAGAALRYDEAAELVGEIRRGGFTLPSPRGPAIFDDEDDFGADAGDFFSIPRRGG